MEHMKKSKNSQPGNTISTDRDTPLSVSSKNAHQVGKPPIYLLKSTFKQTPQNKDDFCSRCAGEVLSNVLLRRVILSYLEASVRKVRRPKWNVSAPREDVSSAEMVLRRGSLALFKDGPSVYVPYVYANERECSGCACCGSRPRQDAAEAARFRPAHISW